MPGTIRLGSISGIPISISYSWFIILALISGVFFYQMNLELPQWNTLAVVAFAVTTGIVFFASVVAHEMAHSLVALRHGVPVRGITLFMLGGVSHIGRDARRPWSEFIIAFAGPLLSLILGAGLLAVGEFAAPALTTGALRDGLVSFSLALGMLNVALGCFNLLPGFPLDGGRLVRAALWAATGNVWLATSIAITLGQTMSAGLACTGIALTLYSGNPLFLWSVLVGVYLFSNGRAARRANSVRRRLEGMSAGEIARFDAVPATATLAHVQEMGVLRDDNNAAVVTVRGAPVGALFLSDARRVPTAVWGGASIEQVMTPLARLPRLRISEPALEAVDLLDDEGEPAAVLVTSPDERRPVGIITRETVLATLYARRRASR